MSDLRELYQEVIIDHGRKPRNFYPMSCATCEAEGFNPLCGDKLNLYLKLNDEQISEVSFTGRGCAISTASASIMSEILVGKTLDEAEQLFHEFHDLITLGKTATTAIGKLQVLAGVKEFPARVKCATLAWHTLRVALKNGNTVTTTE